MRHNVLNCPDPLKALSTRAWYPAGTEQPYRAVREPHSSVTAGGGGGGRAGSSPGFKVKARPSSPGTTGKKRPDENWPQGGDVGLEAV